MHLHQVFRVVFGIFLYKVQVYGLKVLWTGMGVGTWCKGDGRTRAGADSCTKSPFVANEKSQRKRSVPAIPFHILRIIPENAILVRNFVKNKGNDAK